MSTPSESVPNHTAGKGGSDEKVRSYCVILCRGEQQTDESAADDEYESRLREIGISDVRHVPLLHFCFRNQKQLIERLNDDSSYTGLILTSPRAVNAVSRVADAELMRRWAAKQNFTIGPKTSARAHACGLTRTLHQDVAGNSRILGLSIVKQFEDCSNQDVRFLMPCSSIARDEVSAILRENSLTVTSVPAYDTVPCDDAELRLSTAIENSAADSVLIVFFSPSNVAAAADHLKTTKHSKKLYYVSIGSTTSAALESYNMPVICTSALPTAESLAHTMKSPARLKLDSWLNQKMRIVMVDGRILIGVFLCTDRDRNVILGSANEYIRGEIEEPRTLGLALVPGSCIRSIAIDETCV